MTVLLLGGPINDSFVHAGGESRWASTKTDLIETLVTSPAH